MIISSRKLFKSDFYGIAGTGRIIINSFGRSFLKEADLKKPLKVKFVESGEEGMDQGGVQKELFAILLGQLLDPSFGMFSELEENRYCWFNPATLESERKYELVGTIIGLAVYNGIILGTNFPPLVYKKLLDEPADLEDIKETFPALGRGLQQLLDWEDGDVSDIFMRTFEISYDVYGEVKTFPLIADGDDVFVTNANREDYVSRYINHLVNEAVKRPFRGFQKGFYKVCGGNALKLCRPEELQLLVCGSSGEDLDFHDLELGAQYDDGYEPNHPTIQAFWRVVHRMPWSRKKKLLNFVTASDRVPVKGLKQVLFVVQRNGPDTERLPTALTCFGRLLLPEYRTEAKLEERLTTAIEEARGFGLV